MPFKILLSGFLCFFLFSFNLCFAQQPRLVLPFGHTESITSARFSNDGKIILTASNDSSVIIWDVVSEKQLYALKGHKIDVQIARTSFDEKYIVTGSSDGTARIWDEKTGDSIQMIEHSGPVVNAFFLKQNNVLITQTIDSVFSWDWKGNIWVLNVCFKGAVLDLQQNAYLYNKNDSLFLYKNESKSVIPIKIKQGYLFLQAYMSPLKYIITYEDSGHINLYDKANGDFLKRIKLSGNNEIINSPAFNQDESQMFYKADYYKTDSRGKGFIDADDKLSIINLNSGKAAGIKVSEGCSNVYTIGKDSLLITPNWNWDYSIDKSYIYSISRKEIVKEFYGGLAKINSPQNTIISIKNHGLVLTRLSDNSTSLLETKALMSNILINDSILQTKFSDTISSVFTWNYNDNRFHLAKDSLRLGRDDDLKFSKHPVSGYFFHLGVQFYNENENEYGFSRDNYNSFLFRKKDNKILFKDSLGTIKDVKVHEPSNTFAIIGKKDHGTLYSLSSGKKLFTLVTTSQSSYGVGGGLRSLRPKKIIFKYDHSFENNGFSMDKTHYFFNNSGTHFYEIIGNITNTGYHFNNIYVWNVADGKLSGSYRNVKNYGKYSVSVLDKVIVLDAEFTKRLLTVELNRSVNQATCFEDKLLLAYDDLIEIYDILSGKLEKQIPRKESGHSIIYDTIRKQFLEIYANKIIKYNQEFIPQQTIYSNNLPLGSTLKLIKNNELLLIGSGNYLTVFSLLYYKYFHLFFLDHDNWIVLDGNGNFDGTEEARKTLYLTCGTEVVDLDQLKDQVWVPNLAERIMKGETINAKSLNDLNICGLTPEVEELSTGSDEYFFKIKPRRGGLGETVLLVNGIEARRYKTSALKKNADVYELVVSKEELKNLFIAGKNNPVTLKAYTADNTISSRGLKINEDKTKEAATPPNLYAVMVGVSDYKGEELDLKYAAKDANDISAAVGNAAKKLLNTDGKEHVFIYNLTTATDRDQLPEKNAIKKILEEIGKKATANDILMIFFAGHGVMEGEKKQFYFLTSDASKSSAVDAIADVGISTTELTEWMKPQNIRAQKRILIFDACNSGQAIKDFVQMGTGDQHYIAGRSDDKAQQIKAIDKLNEKSGLFILSASASNQAAYEMGRYAQGLLTYALLKAIKQQPDILDQGKYLDVSRWFNAAEKTVSEISKESGARQEPQIVSNTNFNIGIIDDEVMAKINLPQEKPLFAASNFQNNDEAIADDDLELSKQINLQLNNLSARGIDASIVYLTATNSPDAYSLSGRYTVTGNAIMVSVNVKQNKTIKTKFELSGTKDKFKELAAAVAEKAASLVK